MSLAVGLGLQRPSKRINHDRCGIDARRPSSRMRIHRKVRAICASAARCPIRPSRLSGGMAIPQPRPRLRSDQRLELSLVCASELCMRPVT